MFENDIPKGDEDPIGSYGLTSVSRHSVCDALILDLFGAHNMLNEAVTLQLFQAQQQKQAELRDVKVSDHFVIQERQNRGSKSGYKNSF